MKAWIACTVMLLIMAVGGFAQNPDVGQTAQADNAFGFKLLTQTRKLRPGENVFQSPLGMTLALTAVATGAGGQTLREMTETLGAGGATIAAMNLGNRNLLDQLAKLDPKIKLEIATSVWKETGAGIKPDYLSRVKESYLAEVQEVDFADARVAGKINDWVNQNTHGVIPTMVEGPLPRDVKLMVLNAVYFKGGWEKVFDKKLTQDKPFKLRDGKTAPLPRMSLKDRFGYIETPGFQAVILPYASRQVSLYVFLPKDNLDKFTASLTPENWAQWTRQFAPREGTVELPRFKVENTFHPKEELERMGMARAFTARAEFGGISTEPLQISDVEQKTFVEVNEEGTVAAAATSIRMRPTIAMRPVGEPFVMVVDHPFYMAIRENSTGAILFHGTIEDPRGH